MFVKLSCHTPVTKKKPTYLLTNTIYLSICVSLYLCIITNTNTIFCQEALERWRASAGRREAGLRYGNGRLLLELLGLFFQSISIGFLWILSSIGICISIGISILMWRLPSPNLLLPRWNSVAMVSARLPWWVSNQTSFEKLSKKSFSFQNIIGVVSNLKSCFFFIQSLSVFKP